MHLHNKEGESRNNHLYAVVVQDLATHWIQSYPRVTKTSQETENSSRIPRAVVRTTHWSFANLVQKYH